MSVCPYLCALACVKDKASETSEKQGGGRVLIEYDRTSDKFLQVKQAESSSLLHTHTHMQNIIQTW